MVTDSETNLLYLADCLPSKFPTFSEKFLHLLDSHSVNYEFLPNTRDIWAVDYMPIQLAKDSFVSFTYDPDYLRTKAGAKTKSDTDQILREIGLFAKKSDIILDGGNVVKGKDQAILCDKVFRENPGMPVRVLIRKLEEALEVSRVIFLPTAKNDFTGHADGMVRFIDEHTVFVNDYGQTDIDIQRAVIIALNNAGLETVELPYDPYLNTSYDDASGIYINYLEMEGMIILPAFGMKADEDTVMRFEKIYPNHQILTVNSSNIAKQGGILNCISWNVKK